VQELIQFQLAIQGMVLVVQALHKLLSLLRRMVAEILETMEVLQVLEVLGALEVLGVPEVLVVLEALEVQEVLGALEVLEVQQAMRMELVHQSQSSARLLPYPLSTW
jgi:hypothetical protein